MATLTVTRCVEFSMLWCNDDRPGHECGSSQATRICAEAFRRRRSKCKEVLRKDPLSGHLFVFRGRRSDLGKMIWHDGQGAWRRASAGPAGSGRMCGMSGRLPCLRHLRRSIAPLANRRGEHPQRHLAAFAGILQADRYSGFEPLFAPPEGAADYTGILPGPCAAGLLRAG